MIEFKALYNYKASVKSLYLSKVREIVISFKIPREPCVTITNFP